MKLVSAKVGPFRSINTEQTIAIDPEVTVFVGMNEAGKTVFLKALHKSNDAMGSEKFNPIEDYPRKDYTAYSKRHADTPEAATTLTYRPTTEQISRINAELHTTLAQDFQFSVAHKYDNTRNIVMTVKEAPVILALANTPGLSTDTASDIKKASSLRQIAELLAAGERTDADKSFLAEIQARIAKTKWDNVVQHEVWSRLETYIPKFLYFSDYDLLPGKLNLDDLAKRVAKATSDPANAQLHIKPNHQAVLALLRMADVNLTEISGTSGYEAMKAKIEAVSISLTDQVLEFWKQNEDLEVEVDIKPDTTDEAPFNNGPNLYLRIKNRRHRGVSTPFDQRSRGFIWFFSFLVWFDSVQHQLDPGGKATPAKLVLLLDEPGLALHALAQADFLRYIDNLSKQHQVLYTTHSPFMVNSNRLHQVRVVEDKDNVGTVISDNLSDSDQRTIFPLQAALGWTIAQNLFISKQNLLVEGPSELTYLQCMSALLEAQGGKGLKDDVTIVPVGGLSNLATFVSLLGASGLELSILHDYSGSPEQRLEEMVRQKLLAQKSVFNVSQFRDISNLGKNTIATDVEDLLDPEMYLNYFNKTYAKQLGENSLQVSDLPKGDRIIHQIERALAEKGITLRPSGGFNHYLVASTFGSAPPKKLDKNTITRFSALFEAVNCIFTER
ncbi:hypothetical protein GALL_118500 [mine drainage metagenome]|uniref:Uncharacterized protein n=1 Tax=mine drainage metagenome TaxID=410659 RepID=A0A1J5SPS4_9ZZZZ